MSEASHQRKIMQRLEKDGWYVLKLIKTNKNGIPDLLALKKDKIPFFIEVKGEKGKLSTLQKYRIGKLKKHGFKIKVDYEKSYG